MEGPPSGVATVRMARPDGTASPKTRACSNCARLKMKCQWPAAGSGLSGNTCARCSRMNISCHVPVLPPRKKRGKGTRVAQLEQKIDGLVSLLAAGHHLQASASSPSTPESQESTQANSQVLQETSNSRTEEARSPAPIYPVAGDGLIVYEMIPEFQLTTAQAQTYLDVFRVEYTPRFPFVVISPQTTPSELYSREICLFWAIMNTVAPLPGELQLAVKKSFREYVSDHVIVRKDKRLGNLQAILIYIAWSEVHVFFDSNATSLLSLAHSLVIDLKLDKSSKAITLPPRTLLRDAFDTFNKPTIRVRSELSLDDKRALLGYYHQSSLVATFFRRGQAPPWNNHYTQCCESLAEASQSYYDQQLAALVNLQRVFDRALNTLAMSSSSDTVYSAPLDMAIHNVRREVEDLMRSQTRRLKNDKILRMFKCSLLLRLYEPVFAMQPGSIAGPGGYSPGPVQRTDCIWEAIRTSTEFFDTYLDTTPAELSFLPSTFISLHAFSNIATSRILTADASPDWDPATARRTIDYVGYLTRISEQYRVAEQLAQKNGWKRRVMDSEIPAFTKFSNKLQWIAQWYIGRIDPEQQLVNDSEDGQAGTDHTCWEDETFENVWQDLMSFQDPGAFGHFGFDAF